MNVNKLMEKFKNLDYKYKIGIGTILIAVLLVSFLYGTKPDTYQTLYTGMEAQDSQEIVRELVGMGIDYRLEEAGSVVKVEGLEIAKVRLQLASLGLPRNGNPGYELFDQTSITETRFDKDRKFERALKGQLENDLISGLESVQRATVTLSLKKEESIFRSEDSNSKATVVLGIRTGTNLSDSQIRGVQNFVSSAIPNMKAEDVVVLDEKGTMLSNIGSSSDFGSSQNLTKQQQIVIQTEERIKNDIMRSLSKVFGYDNVTINVRARINFDEIVRNIEKYDPNNVLRSRQRSSEQAEKLDGVNVQEPGAEANGDVPDYKINDTDSDTVLKQTKEDIIENFEVSKTVETIKENPELTNLNVVVWLDRTLSEEEKEGLKRAVAVSSGISDVDGDGKYDNGEVEVMTLFFDSNMKKEPVEEPVEETLLTQLFGENKTLMMIIFILIGAGMFLLIIAFMLSRGKDEDEVGVTRKTVGEHEEQTVTKQTLTPEEENKQTSEKLLQGLTQAKKLNQMQEQEEDDETIKRKTTLTEKADEEAKNDPKKTSDYIKKLMKD